jgi:hypothetical protein
MYIDTGFGLYEVIKYIDNNFYICKFIKYSYFLDLYYKNIIKNSLEETCDILELFNENKYNSDITSFTNNILSDLYNSTTKKYYYCEKTDTFFGPGTYAMRADLFKIGYNFDKNTKKWIIKSQDEYKSNKNNKMKNEENVCKIANSKQIIDYL